VNKPLALRKVLTPLWSAALIALAMLSTGSAFAQETPPPDATTVSAEAAAPAEAAPGAAAEAAPAEEAAAPTAPTFDKGDVSWVMTSTLLVILMAIPGLALFYGPCPCRCSSPSA
jgi:Amt family ammonium transporter